MEPSVRAPLSLETQKKLIKKREERNSQKSLRILREKLQNSTRRDSHSHNTHALKTFTSSHLLRKKKRERERGTFHSRALSFLLRREVVSSSKSLVVVVLKIGTLLTASVSLIKNPPRRNTQATPRTRKNAHRRTRRTYLRQENGEILSRHRERR